MSDARNTIIIGSGPAGYAAALYLARARLEPLMFAGEGWGGQLMLTTDVENYPGFEDGILGPDLMTKMRRQAQRFGSEIVDRNVTWVDFTKQPFLVGTGKKPQEIDKYRETLIDIDKKNEDRSGEKSMHVGRKRGEQRLSTSIDHLSTVFQTRSVIISTGAQARMLGIGEERLLGKGVSTCAVCDAAFFKDKITFVVGGGDAAMEEALALVHHAKSITLIHRRDTLRASKIMQQRVLEKNRDKVQVLWNSQVKAVNGTEKLESIVVENTKSGVEQTLPADGLFIAIGHLPATRLFTGHLGLDEKGYLLTGLTGLRFREGGGEDRIAKAGDSKSQSKISEELWLEGYPTMTTVPGVFAAGDVVDFRYRQAVTAAGFGCMAALDAERYLEIVLDRR